LGNRTRDEIAELLADLSATNPSVHSLLTDLARAVVDKADRPHQDDHFPRLSDIRIADEPDGASTKGKPMRRVHGPYRHHDRWRIKIVDRTTGRATNQTFPTEEEAQRAITTLQRKIDRESGISVGQALDLYERYLAEKGNKPRSNDTTMHRLRSLLGSVSKIAIVSLTAGAAGKLYDRLLASDGSPMSVETKRNVLNQSKTFLKWCKVNGHARINPWRTSKD